MNVKDVVNALGGRLIVAELLSVTPATVTNWCRNGYLVGPSLLLLHKVANEHGIEVKLTDMSKRSGS